MKLLRRLYESLFSPGKIGTFKEDKRIFTFIYFLLLVALYSIPSIIVLVLSRNITSTTKEEIRSAFVFGEEIPYEIENNKLVFNGENEKDYYLIETDDYQIYFSSSMNIPENTTDMLSYTSTSYKIVFSIDGIYDGGITKSLILSYDQFDLNGMDFSKAKQNDYDFWKIAFTKLNTIVEAYRTQTQVFSIIVLIATSIFSIGLLSLIVVVFGRFGYKNKISFSKHWQLCIYAMTPMVLGELFAVLFGIELLYYVGIFITFIYSIKIDIFKERG